MAYKTNLKNGGSKFADMMNDGFGIVTVMNAYVCDALPSDVLKTNCIVSLNRDIGTQIALVCVSGSPPTLSKFTFWPKQLT